MARSVTISIGVSPDSDRSVLVPGTYKPDSSTTGVLPGTPLTTYEGNFIFSSDNQLVQNLYIKGSVDFNSKSGCTLRNCVIEEPTPREMPGVWRYGVRQFGASATGTIIEDCEIYPKTPGENHGYGYWGFLNGGYFRRNSVHGFIDGCNVSSTPGNIEANWFHDSTTWSPHTGWTDNKSHNDAIQMSNAIGWTIRGNTFNWAVGGTANVLVTRGAGPTHSNVFDKNWFDGGYLCMNFGDATLGGQTITNNLAAEQADFSSPAGHLFIISTVQAASILSNNKTYGGSNWYVYNPS